MHKKIRNTRNKLFIAYKYLFSSSPHNIAHYKQLLETIKDVFCYLSTLRAFQCNATKLQICTKIYSISPYMLLNPSAFFKIYVYDLFLRNKKMKIALFKTGSYGITYKNVHFSPSNFSKKRS